MTIKEIESLSGIPRANIRYYEQEGLITPKRLANGYRAYSEEELAVLEKIKLLRGVGVSLDDIRALQNGEDELSAVLSRRLRELENEAKAVEEAKVVCRAMRGAGESYATLDAAKYMNSLPEETQKTIVIEAAEPAYPPCPWRRYFARAADMALYRLVIIIFVAFGLRVSPNSLGADIIIACFVLVFMLFLEPLQLMLFKTTFGKMLFGLKVVNNDGGRLSYAQGFQRVKDVVLYGMGITIPIVEWVRNWKCYRRCEEGKTLEWEYESTVVPADMKWHHTVKIIAAVVLWVTAITLVAFGYQLPPNRGDLTVAEFAENYNFIVELYDMNLRHMDENGQLYHSELDGGDGSIGLIGSSGNVIFSASKRPRLEFEYTLENGLITAVSAYGSIADGEIIESNDDEQVAMAFAFAGARKEMGMVNNYRMFMEERIRRAPFEDLSFELRGVLIERDVECRGYHDMGNMLVAKDGVEKEYSESFRISIIE